MYIRKLLSIARNNIVVIAGCLFITISCVCAMCLFRHPIEVMTTPCLETSPRLLDIPIHTYTPTYITVIDTDGMEHTFINPILIGPSGSSILKDIDGHTVIFYKGKFYHGLDRTQCHKCHEHCR